MLTQRQQPSHQIALIKPIRGAEELIEHALQLFDSMLWVFRGTTRANWNLSSPSEADVVVVHHAEPAERIAQWRAQGKVIVVLRTEASLHNGDDHTLIYPFPASQVMSLLERLDAQLDGHEPAPAPPRLEPAEVAPAEPRSWSLVESIRTLRAARNPELWLAVRNAEQPLLWLRGDAAKYQCSTATLQAIHEGTLPLDGLTLERSLPRFGLVSGRGSEFTWFAAYHTSDMLAPWLSEAVPYRLRRWPDLGLLRPADPAALGAQLRITATLDSAPATAAELPTRAGVSQEQAVRTLNALAACDLIEVAVAATAAERTSFKIERPKMGFRQLFDSIRRHLHLGSAR